MKTLTEINKIIRKHRPELAKKFEIKNIDIFVNLLMLNINRRLK